MGSLVVALLAAGVALRLGGADGLAVWPVPLCLLLFAWQLGMIAWHGDSVDMGRHALQSGVQARPGILLLIFFARDRIVRRGGPACRTLRG